MFKDVNLKSYFGRKLKTTINTNVSEIETDTPLSDWWRVDGKAYLYERAETRGHNASDVVLPRNNPSIDLFTACLSILCKKKIVIVHRENWSDVSTVQGA